MAACGFAFAASTGAGLLATKATEYVGNPFLYLLPIVAVGFANALMLRRSAAWRALGRRELSRVSFANWRGWAGPRSSAG